MLDEKLWMLLYPLQCRNHGAFNDLLHSLSGINQASWCTIGIIAICEIAIILEANHVRGYLAAILMPEKTIVTESHSCN